MKKFFEQISNLAGNDKLLFFFCLLILTVPVMKTPNLPLLSQKLQVSELVAIFVILFFALELLDKGIFPRMTLVMIAAIIHMGLMFISFLREGRMLLIGGAIEIAVQTYLFLLFFIAAYLASTRPKIDEAYSAWVWALVMVLAISFLGVLLFALGMRRNPFISMGGLEYSLPSADYPRVESTFVHGSYLANYMAPSFFILAYLRFASGKTSAAARWFWTLTLLFVVIGFLTLSRSFLIWLAVVIPWAMWQNRTDALARTAAVVIALSILAFVALITAWVTFPLHFNIDRKEERLQINLNTKPSPRVEMRRQVWPEISKSPFWGRNLVQASGPAWVAGKYYPAGVAAHNTWLQLWATRGIFGLLSFMFFLAAAVKTGIKKPLTAEQKFLIPALISLLLISSIEHLVHPRFVYLLLGFFAGAGTRPKT